MRISSLPHYSPVRCYSSVAGRNCPIRYQYNMKQAFARSMPVTSGDIFYVIGGLYGNQYALAKILELKRKEEDITKKEVKLIFNGDFNWFNIDALSFEKINATVRKHMVIQYRIKSKAIKGNVEDEISWEWRNQTSDCSGFGCGCAYPTYP